MNLKNFNGIVVTGGAGFLGSHLCEAFIKAGIPVTAVDNFCTSSEKNIHFLVKLDTSNLFTFIKADVITKWDWFSSIKHPISHVFHLASPASPPLYKALSIETLQVNSIGLLWGLEYATKSNARLIYTSTSEVYGDPQVSPQPESYWGNVNSFGERACYDEAKRYGEALLYSFNKKYGTHHGLVRIFNTYGPRMNLADGRVVINFLTQALANKPLTVYGSGNQTRSFCYVEDLISGLLSYASGKFTTPMNLGNNKEFTILELAKCVQELFVDRNIPVVFEPESADDPKQRRPNIDYAKKCLHPWEPKTPLNEGLSRMLEWIKSLDS